MPAITLPLNVQGGKVTTYVTKLAQPARVTKLVLCVYHASSYFRLVSKANDESKPVPITGDLWAEVGQTIDLTGPIADVPVGAAVGLEIDNPATVVGGSMHVLAHLATE